MPNRLSDHPARRLFLAAEWDAITRDPLARVAPSVWAGFSREQQSAIVGLRASMQADRFTGAAPASALPPPSSAATHFAGRDPLTGAATQLGYHPAQSMFTPELWTRITTHPEERLEQSVWRSLSYDQQTAVRAVRAELLQLPLKPIAELLTEVKAAAKHARVKEPWDALPPNRMMAMCFNVENLFDTLDDPGKKDEEFTPLSGYTEATFHEHLKNIGDVIKSVNGGRGPDVLGLVEVENKSALDTLVQRELSGLGYQTIALEEGKDSRGIDVAMVSRFPVWPGTRPRLVFAEGLDGQRGILRVELNVKDQRTVAYVNHWKSLDGGEERSAEINVKIAAALKKDIEATTASGDVKILAMGDFNTKLSEGYQSAIQTLGSQAAPDKVAGASELWDTTHSIRARRSEGVEHPLLPEGSHGREFLDRFMVNGSAAGKSPGLKLDPDSVVVVPTPGRFFGMNGRTNPNGVADHKPIVAQFEL